MRHTGLSAGWVPICPPLSDFHLRAISCRSEVGKTHAAPRRDACDGWGYNPYHATSMTTLPIALRSATCRSAAAASASGNRAPM
jgi:hypothetical protein